MDSPPNAAAIARSERSKLKRRAEVHAGKVKLRPIRAQVLTALLAGHSGAWCARKYNLQEKTISGWKTHDPIFRAEYERRCADLGENLQRHLASKGRKAIEAIEAILEENFDAKLASAAVSAARLVLEGAKVIGDRETPGSSTTVQIYLPSENTAALLTAEGGGSQVVEGEIVLPSESTAP